MTVSGESTEAIRIIMMSSGDIAKRNESDRQEWTHRGVKGIVVSPRGHEITLKTGGMQGEAQATVTVTAKTGIKRYAPDSVKLSEAQTAKLQEITAGDQLRARGVKSEDGLHVDAEELVFGTFVVKGGTITGDESGDQRDHIEGSRREEAISGQAHQRFAIEANAADATHDGQGCAGRA